MKKELILIVAYCPDQERKSILMDFLRDLQKFRSDYDILLTSHTNLDNHFTDHVDFFYYDDKNIVLQEIEFQQNGWYSVNGKDFIWSSFVNIGNYLPAIYHILIPALAIAKSFGYEKIHKFEYDTRINSTQELIENSIKLESFDYILYENKETDYISGNLMSFRTDKIIDLWKTFDLDKIKDVIKINYPRASELVIGNLIKKTRKVFSKPYSELPNLGITSGTKISNKTNYSFPFFDYDGFRLRFLNVNHDKEEYLSEVIVNDKIYLNFGVIKPNCWSISDIDLFKNIQSLTILKNKKVIRHINFEGEFREEFIARNFLEKR